MSSNVFDVKTLLLSGKIIYTRCIYYMNAKDVFLHYDLINKRDENIFYKSIKAQNKSKYPKCGLRISYLIVVHKTITCYP